MKNEIKEILGLKVHGIIHYYNEKKISISFDDSNKSRVLWMPFDI